MKISWFGTAAIVLESGSTRILFDPFVPLKFSKVSTTISDFENLDNILITHGHFDHIKPLPQLVSLNEKIKIHCTKTPYQTLTNVGIPSQNLVEICPDSSLKIGDFDIDILQGRHADLEGLNITALFQPRLYRHFFRLPSILKEHSLCKENNETLFYVLYAEGKTVFLLGSMNLAPDVVYPTGCDLLVLPYTGYKDNLSHADEIIERLKPKKVFLDHFDDTFPPITMDVDTSGIEEKYNPTLPIITPIHKKVYEF